MRFSVHTYLTSEKKFVGFRNPCSATKTSFGKKDNLFNNIFNKIKLSWNEYKKKNYSKEILIIFMKKHVSD